MTRIFPGTVLVEGTELSEGRGTSTPLEVIGAPNFPTEEVLRLLENEAPDWLRGVFVRPCFFEPTFHKHKGQLCTGIQIHTQIPDYDHKGFVPYRLIAGCLKALRLLQPDYSIWRGHYYEYEKDRLPIDVINGGPNLRLWVDDPNASFTEFDHNVQRQCDAWLDERRPFLLY